ncbi:MULTISPECIES: NAD-dependent epimerase/dehydratase family protein [unclassified Micromonospora]|uniref:NAD-dependent epimerase/dehydratase family protein n=1 Tax=unclassified Micromonospora TaxID=2617518 RepID=UPI0003EEE018|nr:MULTISPECIES: NAD-dependent epimerase/dehydratase family protein [unclassified Micromonospora]EWM67982.1 NAD-dependent epimerase/dehydratase [Micromonospora sp. M42]MCK1805344.1 NAD-dependent epimerase/dehydratase family protein [Micromonospora sp. R42106]MCK1830796.1 NAD-dependent epimerase/dehydratase family protein [Micromonospora sp. R42003]MCK1842462.1 NAD-dependent epimerase/dehydratase family protein [Micromonospora sp. R42004]MCM1015847.1 NAD-dependent epimerase/dehydratase family p
MRLLVLGGTWFVGHAIVRAALDAGWEVTTFNRGTSSTPLEAVRPIQGDRTRPRDIAALAAFGNWDAVVDTSGYVPRNTLDVARMLAPVVGRYVFMSTLSVYQGWPVKPLSEQSELLYCPPDAGPDYGTDMEDGPTRYAYQKAGCEAAAAVAFGAERTTILRPGVVYVALLATPILRHFTRSLTPFALIDATMPSSGKTILTAGPGMLYGQRVMNWAYADEELRKSITAVFAEQVGVVIWDNLAEGTVIDSAVLAQLVTNGVWSDRQLGASRNIATVNDRLWMATGNNLQVGGDMASRTVRVHLDPDMPRPELRDQTGFGIPHLDQWITVPANQLTVLWHLLVLVLDWTRQGAPKVKGLSMRQFTPWAQALGGFLAHHGIDGFLTNAAEVREIDEDETRWRAFLTTWHERHAGRPMTAADLRRDAEPLHLGSDAHDPWDGQFITTAAGRLPNPLQLGRLLTGQAGRWRGDHVIRAGRNERGDRAMFWVERHKD